MKRANLALRFLLELCALAALAYWGVETGSNVIAEIVLALGATGLFIAVWGRWVAPRTSARLPDPQRLVVELLLFAAAVAALAAAGEPRLAAVFAAIIAFSELLGLAWDQRKIA